MVNGQGAVLSVISQRSMKTLSPTVRLKPSRAILRMYWTTNESIGEIFMQVCCRNQEVTELPLIVVQQEGPCLMGRVTTSAWLEITYTQSAVNRAGSSTGLSELKYGEVFAEEAGIIIGYKFRISVTERAKPQILKSHPIPFALREVMERALQRLGCRKWITVSGLVLELLAFLLLDLFHSSSLLHEFLLHLCLQSGGSRLHLDGHVSIHRLQCSSHSTSILHHSHNY